jgi:hypothetical protein
MKDQLFTFLCRTMIVVQRMDFVQQRKVCGMV